MPAPYSLQFDDADGLLLALALEQFADQSRIALRELGDTGVLRTTRLHLEQQIAQADALLKRVNAARY